MGQRAYTEAASGNFCRCLRRDCRYFEGVKRSDAGPIGDWTFTSVEGASIRGLTMFPSSTRPGMIRSAQSRIRFLEILECRYSLRRLATTDE